MPVNTKNMDMQDDILISYLLGEASPEEIKQVERWRKTDEACEGRLKEFRLLWETSKNLMDSAENDADLALWRFREKARERANTKDHVLSLKPKMRWLSVAASFLLIAGALWFYTFQHRITEIRLTTNAGTQNVILPDGSQIILNHRSDFEYPSAFSNNQRLVKLRSGEAFFNVAHNKTKPFLINTGKILIRVVGTSFNVKNKNGNVEVIVETGIVEVSKGGHTIQLTPGEKTMVKRSSKTLEKYRSTDQLYNYYRSKEFEAQDTPLWRVVEVLNEAYDSHIVIERKELRNLPLNTTFKNESLDKVLDVISRTFKINVERKRGVIILK